MRKPALLCVLSITLPLSAQDRFPSGEYKGFTQSPTEHVIITLPDSINVRSVRGQIFLRDTGDTLNEVLFEIRGPNISEKIRSATTVASGQFKISKVPGGIYTFKATKSGFQSVTGTLIVSKTADRHATIKIEMPIGS
jgi:hypothetical protein